ncbi:MAG: threonine synthase [Bacillota bacterium]|nr:threonine synthase [Bacillota bacterium]MDI7248592.1 threonine synthase [Bacillota bacterium]
MASYVRHLECARCGTVYDAGREHHLCSCGGPLLVRYDLGRVKQVVSKEQVAAREASLWRYRELLPVAETTAPVSMGEGWTPVLPLPRWGSRRGFSYLYLKDEGHNPTGTFKARGAAVGVARARELRVREIAMPTAGNAGGAWSLYAARAGIRAHVAMPRDAPSGAIKECVIAGARVYLIDGLISDAGKFIARGISKHGWYDASTLKEPYRIEGKKTMGLELAEQFGWELPDVVLYPCGGGVGLIGMWKAFDELEEVGWIGKKRPRLVAVQAEGCAPIVKAFREGKAESEFFSGARTVAGGIRVPKALGDFLILRAIWETGGAAVAVSDDEILTAMRELAEEEGLFICPEGAATLAGLLHLREAGLVGADERIVLFNTGSGLKYTDLVAADLPVLPADAEPE